MINSNDRIHDRQLQSYAKHYKYYIVSQNLLFGCKKKKKKKQKNRNLTEVPFAYLVTQVSKYVRMYRGKKKWSTMMVCDYDA